MGYRDDFDEKELPEDVLDGVLDETGEEEDDPLIGTPEEEEKEWE